VVIAAGTYDEPVLIQDAIEVVGRCPSMVKVTGSLDFGGVTAAIVLDQVDGAGVRRLEVSGSQILSLSSKDVTIDGVVVRGAVLGGILLQGGQMTVTHTWVHDTLTDPVTGDFGDGVDANNHAQLTIEHSAITASRRLSLYLSSKTTIAHVEDSLIEPVLAPTDVGLRLGILTNAKATLELVNSVVTGVRGKGISVGSADTKGSILHSEVRDTLAQEGTGEFGDGVVVFDAASVDITGSVLFRNRRVGLFANTGAVATLDATLVTRTATDPGNLNPDGTAVVVQEGSTVTVRRSVISDNGGNGLSAGIGGAVVHLESSTVERSSLSQVNPLAVSGAYVAKGAQEDIVMGGALHVPDKPSPIPSQ
jgi:hypothetical protein